jgi:DNA-binding NtrC family response regulator
MSPASTDAKLALVLADEDVLRGDMAGLLRGLGFLVEQCADGEAALALVAQHAFDVMVLVGRSSWPRNVRQLADAVEGAKSLAEGDRISIANLPPQIVAGARSPAETPAFADVDLDTVNKMHIAETFRRHDGNKARTARALGIGRRTLYRLLEKYEIGHAGGG